MLPLPQRALRHRELRFQLHVATTDVAIRTRQLAGQFGTLTADRHPLIVLLDTHDSISSSMLFISIHSDSDEVP